MSTPGTIHSIHKTYKSCFVELKNLTSKIKGSNTVKISINDRPLGTSFIEIKTTPTTLGLTFSTSQAHPSSLSEGDLVQILFFKDGEVCLEINQTLKREMIGGVISPPAELQSYFNTTPGVHQGHALLVQGMLPFPVTQGNQKILGQLIKWLKSREFRVILLCQYHINEEAVCESLLHVDELHFLSHNECSKFRSPTLHPTEKTTPHLLWAIQYLINKNPEISETYFQYASFAVAADSIPQRIKTICFTHDVQHRFKKELIFNNIEINPTRICSRGQEAKLLKDTDIIVAINDVERLFFKNMLPDKKVVTVGMFKESQGFAPSFKRNKIIKLLYVASNNEPNRKGLEQFLRKHWKNLQLKVQNLELHIVGSIINSFSDSDFPNVIFKGLVEDLENEYIDATICLNLTEVGTGLKIKTVEAIMYGKATISTLKGAEGIPLNSSNPEIIVCDTQSKIAAKIVELATDTKQIALYEGLAQNFTRSHLSMKSTYSELEKALKEVSPKFQKNEITKHNIFVDITELTAWSGPKTGIQNVLYHFINNLPSYTDQYSFVQYDEERKSFRRFKSKNIDEIVHHHVESEDFNFNDKPNPVYINMGRGWHEQSYLDTLNKSQTKIAHFIHDVIPLSNPQYFGEGLPPLYKTWFNKVTDLSDIIFTNSEYSKKQILNYSKNKVEIKVVRLGDEA